MFSRLLFFLCLLPATGTARENNPAHIAQPKALSFIENKGQITDQDRMPRKDIDVKLETPGMNIFIGNGAIHYQWTRQNGEASAFPASIAATGTSIETYRLDVELVGSNKQAEHVLEEKQDYYENYYLSQCPDGIVVNSYQRITYKNIYPGIDWVLYTHNNRLKYDFVVHPGGNLHDIKLRYNGATGIQLQKGGLSVRTPFGNIDEQAPYCYETAGGACVHSQYRLNGNVVTFMTSDFRGELVIDPLVAWGTYFGGTSGENTESVVAVDAAGDPYIAGATQSSSNIATSGAFQTSFGGIIDGFIAKFNRYGVRLWSTYYGTSASNEYITSVASDHAGYIYAAGLIGNQGGMATTGAYQTSPGGGSDAILVKFNSNGQRVWATYYGGAGDETEPGITCDASNNIIMAGQTKSSSNIATSGSYQTSLSGTNTADGFVVKFNSSGNRQWGTYYGGANDDLLRCVSTDGSGNIYAGGATMSAANIATTGSHQVTAGGGQDGMLVKFSTSGALQWATYYGGSGTDGLFGLACDGPGNVYACGWTGSSGNIATTGSYQGTYMGGGSFPADGFLARFSSAGVRQWGTYYGGTGSDYIYGMDISPSGKLLVTGNTFSTSGIATTGAYQTAYGGNLDAFLAAFSTGGSMLWGTYYGGANPEGAYLNPRYGVACYQDYIYMAGATSSTTGIATTSAYQSALSGGYDAFLVRFTPDTMVSVYQPMNDTLLCPGDTFKVKYITTSNFNSGNSFSVQLSDAGGSFAVPTVIGTKTAVSSDTIICIIPVNAAQGTGYRIRIAATNPQFISEDNYKDIHINAFPVVAATSNSPVCEPATLNLFATAITGGTYSWQGPGSFSSGQQNPSLSNTSTLLSGDYVLTGTLNGCSAKDTVAVVVKLTPAIPTANNNSPLCPGDSLGLTATSTTNGVSYNWAGPVSFGSSQQNPFILNVSSNNGGTYTVTASLNGCASAPGTTIVTIKPTPAIPVAGSNSPVCEGASLNLNATGTAGSAYSWTGPIGFTSTQQNPVINPVALSNAGTYSVSATLNGCSSAGAGSTVVVINNVSSVAIYPSPNDSVCQNNPIATFVAVPASAGSGPQYQWYKNGSPIPGATSLTYNATGINTNDSFQCKMTATGLCSVPLILFSNKIGMTVLPMEGPPAVNISASPGTVLSPWQLVTFTATPGGNAGVSPAYQWKRNGQFVIGAIQNTWSAYNLSDNDVISCDITSSVLCAYPKTAESNKIVIHIKTGVADVNDEHINIYPNPMQDELTIEGAAVGTEVSVSDIVGRSLLHTVASGKIVHINTAQLVRGNYLLQLSSAEGKKVVKLVK